MTFTVHKFGGTSLASAAAIRRCVAVLAEGPLSASSSQSPLNSAGAGREPHTASVPPPTPPSKYVGSPSRQPSTGYSQSVLQMVLGPPTRAHRTSHPRPSPHRVAVVVSAMGGKPKVTDLLLDCVSLAVEGKTDEYESVLGAIRQKHVTAMEELLDDDARAVLLASMDVDLDGLRDVLRALAVIKGDDERIRELVSGHGELWCAQMMAAVLNAAGYPVRFLDARKVLLVEKIPTGDGREILWEPSAKRLAAELAAMPADAHLVVTGFIASEMSGTMTTLRRDGSDYSASIFGKLLLASEAVIWTDVSGVYSADPRRVPGATVVPHLSVNEAMELAYFGAKVIHPKTMAPAVLGNFPIRIRNTFAPEEGGTTIWGSTTLPASAVAGSSSRVVKGFSSIDNLALFNLEGPGLMGTIGVASRLFGCLERHSINTILIAQASSEHSICFAVAIDNADRARSALSEAFFREIHNGDVDPITFKGDVSVVAAVGDGMASMPGTSGRFFAALGSAHINVLAISQGSSERNISVVVDAAESTRAQRALHSAFRCAAHQLSAGLVAPADDLTSGGVDIDELVAQLKSERFHLQVLIRGVTDGRRMWLAEDPIDVSTEWRRLFDAHAVPFDATAFGDHIAAAHVPNWAILDANLANAGTAAHVPGWLTKGIHVVTANAGASDVPDLLDRIAAVSRDQVPSAGSFTDSAIFSHIPVVHSLQQLLTIGDDVTRVELTAGAGMNEALVGAHQGRPFSQDAAAAFGSDVSRGLEDAGTSLARQCVVLARHLGVSSPDVSKVVIEPVVASSGVDRHQADAAVAERVAEAAARDAVVRYAAQLLPTGEMRVGLVDFPLSHPLANTVPGCDAVAVYTERMGDVPLVLSARHATAGVRSRCLAGTLMGVAKAFNFADGLSAGVKAAGSSGSGSGSGSGEATVKR